MIEKHSFVEGPLKTNELQQIEETLLPSIERHRLRLLAHCLACFKEMTNPSSSGSLPNEQKQLEWCLKQPTLANDQAFIPVLLKQLKVAGDQLEEIATSLGMTPLELTLTDLINLSKSGN